MGVSRKVQLEHLRCDKADLKALLGLVK